MADTPAGTGAIILAAGMGTRMKSDRAKVLHEIGGMPMVSYVVHAAEKVAGSRIVIVVGHQADAVRSVIVRKHPDVTFAIQAQQKGTGHAVQCALPFLAEMVADVIILCGDTPLVAAATLHRMLADHIRARRDLTVLAVEPENPDGYGRMLVDPENRIVGIVEEADATAAQKKIKTVNAGIYCASRAFLNEALGHIAADNAQGEYYLTDIMGIGHRAGRNVGAFRWPDSREVMGVNTLQELELAESIMKTRFGKTS